MTYTAKDLRSFADACDGEGLAAMLRAGADAMEKTAQERNLATFRDSLIITAKDEIERLRAELAALKAQEPVAWMDDGTTRAGSHGNTSHRVVTDETRRHMPNAAASAFTVPLYAAPAPAVDHFKTFKLGQRVTKKSGSQWSGRVVGWYSTQLTPEGYAVESDAHFGSVQIYPAKALERIDGPEATVPAVTEAMVEAACRNRHQSFDRWLEVSREAEREKMRGVLYAAIAYHESNTKPVVSQNQAEIQHKDEGE